MTETFEVADDVKLPANNRADPRYPVKYNLDDLKVGRLWFFPDKTVALHGNYLHRRAKLKGMKVKCQTATMKQDDEGKWTPCKPGVPGARTGCAVQRVA